MNVLVMPPYSRHKRVTIIPPLGLLYLGSFLKEKGEKVKIVDFNIDGSTIQKILNAKPRFVGLSMMTCQVYSGIRIAREIKRRIPE